MPSLIFYLGYQGSTNYCTRQGKGLAIIIIYHTCNNYRSFKLLVSVINDSENMLLALVYWATKYSSDFVQEFANFISNIIIKYDKLLICGDFNSHV